MNNPIDKPPSNHDKLLIGWKQIASITPWHDKQQSFYVRFGKDMINRGFVMREKFEAEGQFRKQRVFTWESLVKAYFAWRTLNKKNKKK